MTDDSLSRRAVLGAAGSVTMIALAGCSGSASAGSGASPTQTGSGDHGGDGDHSEEHDFASEQEVRRITDSPVQEATVEMTMLSEDEPVFAPDVAWVERGGSVTWKNVDEEAHTTTAYASANDKPQRVPDGTSAWDSDMLETDDTFTKTFDTEGVYEYYCVPHEGLGMVGAVIVGHPDLSSQPAMDSLQDNIPQQARDRLSDLQERIRAHLSD